MWSIIMGRARTAHRSHSLGLVVDVGGDWAIGCDCIARWDCSWRCGGGLESVNLNPCVKSVGLKAIQASTSEVNCFGGMGGKDV